jgi:hypothetical protein
MVLPIWKSTREVEDEDEQVARAQELSTISADLASATAVADAVREEEEAFSFLAAANTRGATSSFSSFASAAEELSAVIGVGHKDGQQHMRICITHEGLVHASHTLLS